MCGAWWTLIAGMIVGNNQVGRNFFVSPENARDVRVAKASSDGQAPLTWTGRWLYVDKGLALFFLLLLNTFIMRSGNDRESRRHKFNFSTCAVHDGGVVAVHGRLELSRVGFAICAAMFWKPASRFQLQSLS